MFSIVTRLRDRVESICRPPLFWGTVNMPAITRKKRPLRPWASCALSDWNPIIRWFLLTLTLGRFDAEECASVKIEQRWHWFCDRNRSVEVDDCAPQSTVHGQNCKLSRPGSEANLLPRGPNREGLADANHYPQRVPSSLEPTPALAVLPAGRGLNQHGHP